MMGPAAMEQKSYKRHAYNQVLLTPQASSDAYTACVAASVAAA